MRHYVISVSCPHITDLKQLILVSALSRRKAVKISEGKYKTDNDIKRSQPLVTEIIFDCGTRVEARGLYTKLVAVLNVNGQGES